MYARERRCCTVCRRGVSLLLAAVLASPAHFASVSFFSVSFVCVRACCTDNWDVMFCLMLTVANVVSNADRSMLVTITTGGSTDAFYEPMILLHRFFRMAERRTPGREPHCACDKGNSVNLFQIKKSVRAQAKQISKMFLFKTFLASSISIIERTFFIQNGRAAISIRIRIESIVQIVSNKSTAINSRTELICFRIFGRAGEHGND